MNSFLCSLQEFDDFELELETTIDRDHELRASRSGRRSGPCRRAGEASNRSPAGSTDRRWRVRRFYKGQPATGLLYGEALGTGWLSSQQKIDAGPSVTSSTKAGTGCASSPRGPRIQTWVNGHRSRTRQRGGLQDAPARVHRPADPRRERARDRPADPRRLGRDHQRQPLVMQVARTSGSGRCPWQQLKRAAPSVDQLHGGYQGRDRHQSCIVAAT